MSNRLLDDFASTENTNTHLVIRACRKEDLQLLHLLENESCLAISKMMRDAFVISYEMLNI